METPRARTGRPCQRPRSEAGRLEKVHEPEVQHERWQGVGRSRSTCEESEQDGKSSAEGSEGRRPAKENIEQTTTSQTQSWANVLSGLRGVREAARSDKRLQFTALLHHVSFPYYWTASNLNPP